MKYITTYPATGLSMFMLSFIFEIEYSLFEWNRFCAVFLLFTFVLLLEIQLSERDPENQFNPATCFACPKPGPGFPMPYVTVCFAFNG